MDSIDNGKEILEILTPILVEVVVNNIENHHSAKGNGIYNLKGQGLYKKSLARELLDDLLLNIEFILLGEVKEKNNHKLTNDIGNQIDDVVKKMNRIKIAMIEISPMVDNYILGFLWISHNLFSISL